MKRNFGWKPQKPDQRDDEYAFWRIMRSRVLPKAVDLRGHDAPIYDQGDLGSCVSNGTGDCWQFALKAEGVLAPLPARLFIYYNGRVLEKTVDEDSGLEVRDGLKVLAKQGCCDEKFVPYHIADFKKKPSPAAYQEAALHEATSYHAVSNTSLAEMKTCLADGFPIVGGFTVYDSFESAAAAKTGKIPLPGKHESVLGGHCVTLVGYDDATQYFIVRNSWGTGWGDKGYCYMPYAYWTNPNLASDCWTVRMVK